MMDLVEFPQGVEPVLDVMGCPAPEVMEQEEHHGEQKRGDNVSRPTLHGAERLH